MKILILKPSSLGDVIHALPVARLLKRHFPQSEIHWWIDISLASLLEGDPDLHRLVYFQRRRWSSPRHWPEVIQQIVALRAERFDWVLDLQSLARSGAVAWLANGALTVGLDDAREGARGFYDLIVPRRSWHTHAVDWYLEVVRALGLSVASGFTWMPERPEVAARVRERWNPGEARWLALQPGARWENKRWPVEHFVKLIQRAKRDFPEVHFVIIGGDADRQLGRAIAAGAPNHCLDLTGQTSIPEMIEWLRLSVGLVSNDTGPLHAAVALGKPVVALLGPTAPSRTGPYGRANEVIQLDLPCIPCLSDRCSWRRPFECLQGMTPDLVWSRVQPILAAARARA